MPHPEYYSGEPDLKRYEVFIVGILLVLGKFGLVWFRAIFDGPETGRSGP